MWFEKSWYTGLGQDYYGWGVLLYIAACRYGVNVASQWEFTVVTNNTHAKTKNIKTNDPNLKESLNNVRLAVSDITD